MIFLDLKVEGGGITGRRILLLDVRRQPTRLYFARDTVIDEQRELTTKEDTESED